MSVVDRHKEKLIKLIDTEVTALFEQVLNYTEVAIPSNEQYNRLRSKILRLGNNCKRTIIKKVEKDFDVTFNAVNEDVIEFKSVSSGKH